MCCDFQSPTKFEEKEVVFNKVKGDTYFAQNGLDKSSSVNIDRSVDLDPDSPDSYAKLFTIGIWKKDSNKLFQRLRVRIKLKNN
jgi:hypothetical protein